MKVIREGYEVIRPTLAEKHVYIMLVYLNDRIKDYTILETVTEENNNLNFILLGDINARTADLQIISENVIQNNIIIVNLQTVKKLN